MSEHRLLTGASLHDAKGADTSTAGQILYSTGGASDWGTLEDASTGAALAGEHLIADGSGGLSFDRIQGWGQFEDSRDTVIAPTQNIGAGVRTKLINDGAGSTIEKGPSDLVNPLWNVSTNKHEPISAFDIYFIRLSFTAENYSSSGSTSPYIDIELDIGSPIGTIFTDSKTLRKSGSAQAITLAFPVYTGATYLANGGEFYLTYNGTGSCDIYNTSLLIVRESKNYV